MGIGEMGVGEMGVGEMGVGEMGPGDMGVNDCEIPEISELIINEALANPVGNESVDHSEWIEVLNLTDTPLLLEGVSLWSEGELKVNFAALCIPAHSALTLYNLRSPAQWIWSTPPVGDLNHQEDRTFALTNSRPIALELRRGELILNSFQAATSLIESGMSANRNPDATPEGAVNLHIDVPGADGARLSPGLCVNGNRFENLCLP